MLPKTRASTVLLVTSLQHQSTLSARRPLCALIALQWRRSRKCSRRVCGYHFVTSQRGRVHQTTLRIERRCQNLLPHLHLADLLCSVSRLHPQLWPPADHSLARLQSLSGSLSSMPSPCTSLLPATTTLCSVDIYLVSIHIFERRRDCTEHTNSRLSAPPSPPHPSTRCLASPNCGCEDADGWMWLCFQHPSPIEMRWFLPSGQDNSP